MRSYSICLFLSDLLHSRSIHVVANGKVSFIFMVELYSIVCVHAKSLQSRLDSCDPMDCSTPGSSVHGISRQEYRSGLLCPLCLCACVCVHTLPKSFFLKPYLYPSIFDGHLGRFRILAIVNNAAMNRRVACIFSN